MTRRRGPGRVLRQVQTDPAGIGIDVQTGRQVVAGAAAGVDDQWRGTASQHLRDGLGDGGPQRPVWRGRKRGTARGDHLGGIG